MSLRLVIPDDSLDALVEQIAERAAAIVLDRLDRAGVESEFLSVEEAAGLLRAKPQRIYDMRSDARLTKHGDGSRPLIARAELVAHLSPNGDGSWAEKRLQR